MYWYDEYKDYKEIHNYVVIRDSNAFVLFRKMRKDKRLRVCLLNYIFLEGKFKRVSSKDVYSIQNAKIFFPEAIL